MTEEPNPPLKPVRKRALSALGALLVLGAAGSGFIYESLHGWQSAKARTADRAGISPMPVPVGVETAKLGDFSDYLSGLGTVEALNSVTVRAQVSGQIDKIDFKEGQLVKEGDPLVEIDPRPLRAALDETQAKLAQDQASLKDARTNLDRYSDLAQRQFVSRQQLDTQAATVSQGEAQVQSDQAAIENARTQLGYASIRAPIGGRVGFRLVDVGNIVGPSDANGIVTIEQQRPISVVFTAPQDRLGDITAALARSPPPVSALDPDSRPIAEGRLSLVNNVVDTASGTIRLKALFPNEDDRLWPGLSVTTRMPVATASGVTLVPALAVQHSQDGLFVYVVGQGGKAEMRKVTLAGEDETLAVVAEGVKPGETVVTSGQYRLQPGTPVAASEVARQPSTRQSAARDVASPRTAEN